MSAAALDILRYLRDHGPASRAELARAVSVSAAALTKITAELITDGRVSEAGGTNGQARGRPAINIALNADSQYVVGLHLGAGRAELLLSNMLLETSGTKRFHFDPTQASAEEVIAQAAKEIGSAIDRSGVYRSKLRGIGVSVPGEVDPEGRRNIYSSFSGWREVAIAERIEQILGLPAVLEHNATAIALSEARYGAGRTSQSTLYIYMAAGIGAGMAYSNPTLHQAIRHRPIEIGHIVVDPNGPACSCGGRGCLEAYFSESAILEALGLRGLPSEGLFAAAMKNSALWSRLYERLVQAIATVVAVIRPDLIILGGHFGEAPDRLLEDLNRDLRRRVMPNFAPDIHVRRTSLGHDDSAKGAACVGLEKFVYGDAAR